MSDDENLIGEAARAMADAAGENFDSDPGRWTREAKVAKAAFDVFKRDESRKLIERYDDGLEP